MPPVSVVIPCFNAASYVGAAIDSVFAQAAHDVEVIVVDDGSTDDSVWRLKNSHPSVRIVEQRNGGAAAARNQGIALARHEWIALLDADDIWLPGKLDAQFRLLASRPDARMVYGAWHVWHCTDPVPTATFVAGLLAQAEDRTRWDGPSGWIYPQLLLDCEVWTSTVVMHRSLVKAVGDFDTSLRVGEDYDFWLRSSRVTPILRVPRPLALYRMHGTSITHTPPAHNYKGQVVSRAVSRWGYTSTQGESARPSDVRRVIARSWSDFAATNLAAGALRQARFGSMQALRTDPSLLRGWMVLAQALTRSIRNPGG